jgi:hypothetical protein
MFALTGPCCGIILYTVKNGRQFYATLEGMLATPQNYVCFLQISITILPQLQLLSMIHSFTIVKKSFSLFFK